MFLKPQPLTGPPFGKRIDCWFVRCFALAACLLVSGTVRANDVERPNLVFILCDDLGWGDLGVFYQNQRTNRPRHRTPQLDAMAQQGMQLRAHYCPAPVCAPSRASLLTGVHQGHAEVRDNQFDKALEANHTLGSVLQTAGYRTAMIGKYGLPGAGDDPETWPAYPTKRGFDTFYGYVRHRDGHIHYPADRYPLGNNELHREPKPVWHDDAEVSAGLEGCYTTDLFTARSKAWIQEHVEASPDQPFFLYLAYDTPHAALQVPAAPYPAGGGIDGGVQWLGRPGRMMNTAGGEIDSFRHPDYVDRGWSDVAERFATMVRRIDSAVGDLLQTLRDLDIDKNTLVVLTSDNGPHRESYLRGKNYTPEIFQSYGRFDGLKRDCWEGGIRMPTLLWWPGAINAGAVVHEPSQFHDWMPTFAELAGILPPARTDGVSLVPTLLGNRIQTPSTIYIEYAQGGRTPDYQDFGPQHRRRRRGQMQVLHLDGYKGVRVDITAANTPFEIYDLKNDPQERIDLADQSPRFRKLQARMQRRALRLRRPNDSAARPYDDQPIPALSDGEVAEEKLATGRLQWRFREGAFAYVPKLTGQVSTAVGTVAVTEPGRLRVPEIHAAGAVELAGAIQVPASGEYRFALAAPSGGGALMRLHDALVIDADAGNAAASTVTAGVRLEAGWHPITLTYLRGKDAEGCRLQWAFEEASLEPIPAAQLAATK